MNNIYKMVIENAEEANNIINAHGGKIYFVEGLKDCEDEDEFMSSLDDDDELLNIPIVAWDNDLLEELYVCAVMVNESGHIEFLCYSHNYRQVFWTYAASCAYNSDNYVYEYLGALFSNIQ